MKTAKPKKAKSKKKATTKVKVKVNKVGKKTAKKKAPFLPDKARALVHEREPHFRGTPEERSMFARVHGTTNAGKLAGRQSKASYAARWPTHEPRTTRDEIAAKTGLDPYMSIRGQRDRAKADAQRSR